MSINNKKMRRASAAIMATALAITLASCSGATNKYGSLDSSATYASIGDYKITNGELWDELQWNAIDVLNDQVYNAVLNEQITRLTKVLNTNGDYSKLEDKKISHDSDEEVDEDDFKKLYDEYKTRLVDYLVQDIYNFNYSQESYWTNIEELEETNALKLKTKYIDEIYTTYQKSSVAEGDYAGKTYSELLGDVDEDHVDQLFAVAKDLSELYYVSYAKELFTYDSLCDDATEAFADDDDDDDEKYGPYTNTEYVDMFKKKYTNTYDLNLIKIKFTNSTEFNDTLRAFGLYISNDSFYYIYDDADLSVKLDYSSYIDHYDEFVEASANLKTEGATKITGKVMIEIYIMLYNYVYGGYKDMLPSASGVTISYDDLNALREQTLALVNTYETSDQDTLYNDTITALKAFDDSLADDEKVLTYSPDTLEDTYSTSFKTYCYETLKLTDDSAYEDFDSRYSTSLQSANSQYLIVYKFDDKLDEITDEKLAEYEAFYLDKNNTTIDFFDYITKEGNETLFGEILDYLIRDNTSESIISNKVEEAIEDVSVKIYIEATELAYSKDHENYSKTVGSSGNKNLLATISYDDTTYNLNIKADSNDTSSLKIAGTDTAFGVYDYLERQYGATTAIDLLSKKMVKNTSQYEKVKNDATNRDIYNTYLQNILLSFANDGYSSSGYPSTIGKYNFLMLYFHTANINDIINNYYMVQLTSSKLLTDYSNSSLSEFFELYTSYAYEKYFSLSGKRLVVYMDADEDGVYDDASTWINDTVTNWVDYNGNVIASTTKEYVAKQLAYTIYNKVSASANSSHATRMEELVTEITDCAKAEYNDNPAAAENVWARFKKLGLNVALEDVTATNTSTDIDYAIKQRLYDYARGHNEDNSVTYQYYINSSTPTEYIEPLTDADITTSNDAIITSDDGVNLLIITSGTATSSAKWTEEDNEDTLLQNIILKYNEKYVKIENIFNDAEELSSSQIQLYILDNAVNGSSTLTPASIADAYSTFLAPIYTRFTSAETQRIILLYFMKSYTKSTSDIYEIITYSNEAYNGSNGFFKNLVLINQKIADDYSELNNDTTGTSELYPDWWEKLEAQVKNFLINLEEESK